jgi:hypothetical protein
MPARSTSVALPTIATPAHGLPRGAVQIYSDNSDEVMGATLNGGGTGGTWTKAGELLGVTGGPDGGPAIVRRRNADHRHDLRRQRQPEPDLAGELGQPDVRVFLLGKPV